MSYENTDVSNTDDSLKLAKISLVYNQLSLFLEISFSSYAFSKIVSNIYAGDLATEQANLKGCLSSEKAFSFRFLNNQLDAVDYTTNKDEVLLNPPASTSSPLKVIARMYIS